MTFQPSPELLAADAAYRAGAAARRASDALAARRTETTARRDGLATVLASPGVPAERGERIPSPIEAAAQRAAR